MKSTDARHDDRDDDVDDRLEPVGLVEGGGGGDDHRRPRILGPVMAPGWERWCSSGRRSELCGGQVVADVVEHPSRVVVQQRDDGVVAVRDRVDRASYLPDEAIARDDGAGEIAPVDGVRERVRLLARHVQQLHLAGVDGRALVHPVRLAQGHARGLELGVAGNGQRRVGEAPAAPRVGQELPPLLRRRVAKGEEGREHEDDQGRDDDRHGEKALVAKADHDRTTGASSRGSAGCVKRRWTPGPRSRRRRRRCAGTPRGRRRAWAGTSPRRRAD